MVVAQDLERPVNVGSPVAANTTVPPPQQEEDFDFAKLVGILWRQKYLISGTIVVLALLVVFALSQLVPRYTAEAKVLIDAPRGQLVDIEAVLSGLPADAGSIETEMQVIQSRGLAEKTVTELRLDQDPEFNAALRESRGLRNVFSRIVSDGLFRTAAVNKIDDGVGAVPVSKSGWADVLTAFDSRLQVAQVGISRVISINYTSENPQTAAAVANTLADYYVVAQLEAKFDATQRANAWLGERLAELRTQVEQSETAVENFKEASGLVQGRDSTLTNQQISEISTQLVLARTLRVEAEARLRQVEDVFRSGRSVDTIIEVVQSPLIRSLREQEVELERELASLGLRFGERHPQMINARAEMADLRSSINAEIDKIVRSLSNEVDVAGAREAAMNESLTSLKRDLVVLNKSEVELRALAREAEANRRLFDTFLNRSKEVSAQSDFQQADASIISRADPPGSASFPNKPVFLLLGFAAALGLGVIFGFVAETMDRGFTGSEQMERQLGVPTLGIVPKLSGMRRFGMRPEAYVLRKPTSGFGESLQSLYMSLLFSDVDRPPKTVLVTSSLPKEGKSSLVASLARLLAHNGQSVLVIDCDLRLPNIHKVFGLDPKPGVTDFVQASTAVEYVINQDRRSGVHVIPAGSTTTNPSNILASRAMQQMLQQVSQKYDTVLIDSPPVLAVSDSRILSNFADKTIYLVRWKETRREIVRSGLKLLSGAGGEVAGTVLTMTDAKKHAQYSFGDTGNTLGRLTKYYVD